MGGIVMTQEEKELLLKDLCARVPYGVRYRHFAWDDERGEECIAAQIYSINSDGYVKNCYDDETDYINNVRPYLFPLSSMTDKQKVGYNSLRDLVPTEQQCEIGNLLGDFEFVDNWRSIDYLNTNHFDYRGLIEKGLAIDATDLNIY